LRTVDHREVLRLIAEGTQVVDVLPAHEYSTAHIAGAIHLPLPKLLHLADRTLDKIARWSSIAAIAYAISARELQRSSNFAASAT